MYTAPVKFPAQALHVTEEAILEVDLQPLLNRQMTGATLTSDLQCHDMLLLNSTKQ